MNNITLFENFISKDKEKYIQHLIQKIMLDVTSVAKTKKYQHYHRIDALYFAVANENIPSVDIVINKWRKRCINKDSLMIILDKTPYDRKTTNYQVTFKQMFSHRVHPHHNVYHQTDKENVQSILKNGLIPKSSQDSKSVLDIKSNVTEYTPAIFAVNSDKKYLFFNDNNKVLLCINTTVIKNKWYIDFNMDSVDQKIYHKDDESNRNAYIMTYESIPVMAISIV